jgi:hypothetical protein
MTKPNGEISFKLEIGFNLTPAEVKKLSAVEQATSIHKLFTNAAEVLFNFGFNPQIIAEVTEELGFQLRKPYSGPRQLMLTEDYEYRDLHNRSRKKEAKTDGG